MLASDAIKNMLQELRDLQRQCEKVVFTNGCFDILHAGHVDLLTKARKLGAHLVVGLNQDESVTAIKGPSRPINRWCDRAMVLEALECVDYVIGFEDETPIELIRLIRPNILVKGKDWEGKEIVGADIVKSYGGEVAIVETDTTISTSKIIERLRVVGERDAKAGKTLRKKVIPINPDTGNPYFTVSPLGWDDWDCCEPGVSFNRD